MSGRDWTRREREALEAELRGRIRGEVRFRDADRALYSTDASIYQVMPLGAVVPADALDAANAVRICLDAGAPVLPRGGATSLAGQTVGRAVVVDLSKHVNRIVELNREARVAVVEPGVVQAHLNAAAAPLGLRLGPDTASGSRATLGGMLGNNSSGVHSIVYGKTVDHVRWVDAVLADGEVHRLGPVPRAEGREAAGKPGVLGRVHAFAERARGELAELIRARYPRVMRRVSGYNLDELLGEDVLDLGRLLVGSEGSLGTALRMSVRLEPLPATKGVALLRFRDLEPAIAATTPILGLDPSAVELMDEMLLDLAGAHPAFARKLWFLEEGTRAVQLVEFFAEGEAELADRLGALGALAAELPGCVGMVVAEDAARVQDAWAIRKAGLPLLASIPTARKPLPFVEDTAVDPARLPEFVQRFKEVVEDHDTRAAYYAHASAGCLHIRPLLDLHDPGDRARMESISEAIFELVVEFGGSMSGEHGDGRARSHYNARLFGPEIYRAFRELKAAFDPRGLFNPGQVVDAPAMGDDLRWHFDRPAALRPAGFHWEAEGGFRTAVEACNGTAACRQEGAGTMCPSFRATHDEEHSTRGRANLLRAAMTGALPPAELYGDAVGDALELCLSCKACKSECPVKVDMARIKAEWLHGRQQARGKTLGEWALARPRDFLDMAAAAPGLANRLAGTLAPVVTRALGMDPAAPLPELDPVGLRGRLASRERRSYAADRGPVVLLADTFGLHLEPGPLLDAVAVLEAAGHEVRVPELGCCGRPAVAQGDLDLARTQAEALVDALLPHAEAGTPVLGVEPACLSMLWDDAPELLRGEAARRVAGHVKLVDEHLLELLEAGWDPELAAGPAELVLHPHCHQEALGRSQATRALLARLPGTELAESEGCCGMAGDFGYRHPRVAEAVWRQTPLAAAAAPACVPGWTCRGHARRHGKDAEAAVTLLRRALEV